jgi:hypothetical protein
VLSKFCSELELSADRKTVFVRGPLCWDPGEKGRCKIKATITQGGVQAQCDTGSYDEGKDRWDCSATAASPFQADATANAHGVITMEEGDPPDPWPDQQVKLVPHGSNPQCPEFDEC